MCATGVLHELCVLQKYYMSVMYVLQEYYMSHVQATGVLSVVSATGVL